MVSLSTARRPGYRTAGSPISMWSLRRTGEAAGAKGLSAFIVRGDNPGLSVAERIEVMAPHPLARLTFKDCRVGTDDLIGAPGDGFKIAMATLDVFRTSVGAAALGFARRALAETTQARQEPRIVRRSIVGIADGPGPHCRYGGRDRRGGASCLSRRVDQGHGCGARDARGSDGQTLRDRGGAACDRRRRANSWRRRRALRPSGRDALSGNPRACEFTKARPTFRKSSSHVALSSAGGC